MGTWVDKRHDPEHDGAAAAFDPFYAEFKLASDLPVWLKLQHDIRSGLEKLLAEHAYEGAALESRLKPINERISLYNEHVPNEFLRRACLNADNFLVECEAWQ